MTASGIGGRSPRPGTTACRRSSPATARHRYPVTATATLITPGNHWSIDALTDPRCCRRALPVGLHARLERDEDPETMLDVLPLLVATDGAIAAFGRDRRRLRPNLVVGETDGLDERQWPGS